MSCPFESLTYRELQSAAKDRGLKANGKSDELIKRLRENSIAGVEDESAETKSVPAAPASPCAAPAVTTSTSTRRSTRKAPKSTATVDEVKVNKLDLADEVATPTSPIAAEAPKTAPKSAKKSAKKATPMKSAERSAPVEEVPVVATEVAAPASPIAVEAPKIAPKSAKKSAKKATPMKSAAGTPKSLEKALENAACAADGDLAAQVCELNFTFEAQEVLQPVPRLPPAAASVENVKEDTAPVANAAACDEEKSTLGQAPPASPFRFTHPPPTPKSKAKPVAEHARTPKTASKTIVKETTPLAKAPTTLQPAIPVEAPPCKLFPDAATGAELHSRPVIVSSVVLSPSGTVIAKAPAGASGLTKAQKKELKKLSTKFAGPTLLSVDERRRFAELKALKLTEAKTEIDDIFSALESGTIDDSGAPKTPEQPEIYVDQEWEGGEEAAEEENQYDDGVDVQGGQAGLMSPLGSRMPAFLGTKVYLKSPLASPKPVSKWTYSDFEKNGTPKATSKAPESRVALGALDNC